MDGAGAPKPAPKSGLLWMAFGLTAASFGLGWVNECWSRVGATRSSAAKNNQLRTGADKGNPTV